MIFWPLWIFSANLSYWINCPRIALKMGQNGVIFLTTYNHTIFDHFRAKKWCFLGIYEKSPILAKNSSKLKIGRFSGRTRPKWHQLPRPRSRIMRLGVFDHTLNSLRLNLSAKSSNSRLKTKKIQKPMSEICPCLGHLGQYAQKP